MEGFDLWKFILEFVDLLSKIAQTALAGFGAWLAWKTFLKEDDQEAEVIDDCTPVALNPADLKIFETSKQTTWLKKTASGIECHLDDNREGKRNGHRWTLSKAETAQILASGDIYVNPGFKIRTGLMSVGSHTNWLYSKRLYPDPAGLHHKVVELLRASQQ